jgi:tripartite-type tricarboxylate transporter receptor subunit TctC
VSSAEDALSLSAGSKTNQAVVLATLWLFSLNCGCAQQSQFPDQPISIICPWSAGGGTDRVARQVAAQLESEFGCPVNVINATGGGGVTGHTRGAVARPDGYTLTMITVELSMLHWRGLTNITHQDFEPLQLLNRDAAALFVRNDSRYRSLNDLQAAISTADPKLKASGTAYGGIWHIAVAGWLDARGLPADGFHWISINGAGPSIQELLAGGVDFICCSLPEADAVLAGGQVRCLGVMSDGRIKGFEDVPTFKEQAHDWSIAGWRGLAAPRDTPPERISVLSDAIARVTQTPAFLAFMESSGFDVSLEGPSEFAQTLERQDRLFGDILTSEAFGQVSGEHFGPMMFPAVIGIGLALTLMLVVYDIRRGTSESEPHPTIALPGVAPAIDAATEREAGPRTRIRGQEAAGYLRAATVLAAVIFYVWVSEPMGFIAAVVLMLSGLLVAFGARRSVAISVAAVAALISYQVFGILLRVPLPRGYLEW